MSSRSSELAFVPCKADGGVRIRLLTWNVNITQLMVSQAWTSLKLWKFIALGEDLYDVLRSCLGVQLRDEEQPFSSLLRAFFLPCKIVFATAEMGNIVAAARIDALSRLSVARHGTTAWCKL